MEQNNDNKPVYRIRPSSNAIRRGIDPSTMQAKPSQQERRIVRPEEIVQKTSVQKPLKDVEAEATDMLGEYVTRMRNEVREFNKELLEQDALNRESVENGIEEVEGEDVYRLEDLRNNTKNNNHSHNNELNDEDEVDRDIEREVRAARKERDSIDISQIKIGEPIVKKMENKNINFEDDTSQKEIQIGVPVVTQAKRHVPTYTEHVEEEYPTVNEEYPTVNEEYYPAEEDRNGYSSAYEEYQTEDTYEEEYAAENESEENPIVEETRDESKAEFFKKESEKLKQMHGEVEHPPVDHPYEEEKPAAVKTLKIMTSPRDMAAEDSNIIKNSSKQDLDLDDEDFDDLDNDEEEEDSKSGKLTDKQIEAIWEKRKGALKSEITEKIINAGKRYNTNPIVISNKVVSLKDVLKNLPPEEDEPVTKWPLTYSGRLFAVTPLKGHELGLLSEMDDFDRNRTLLTRQQAQIMYKHDANPYKPATIESWAKTIPYMDAENMFMAYYAASLKDANYMPIICQNQECQFAELSENLPIENFYKFKNDKIKERFEAIKKHPIIADDSISYESVIHQISRHFAVGIKLPSIYTILYEYGTLNKEFVEKYIAISTLINYIDYLYFIDDNGNTQPIDWKQYPGDPNKTFKSKIQTYKKIIDKFDDVEYAKLSGIIGEASMAASDDYDVTYKIPEFKCKQCGSTIPEQEISARGLLFMRQRLVAMATGSDER